MKFVRTGGWIVGDGMAFHAGCMQTGYPVVLLEESINRQGGWRLTVRFPNRQGSVYGEWMPKDDAVAEAKALIALILDAHQCGSAKA